jgi:hypothetical protein
MTVAEEAKQHRDQARESPGYWFAIFARIYDKFEKLVTPRPNICQIRLAQAYEYCRLHGLPIRLIVLKPRQVGITTMAAAICYHHLRRFRSTMTMIADDFPRSDKLFQILLTFAREDLFKWGFGFKPPTADNLTLNNGSEVEKKTAKVYTSTLGGTVQVMHRSECAFWPRGGVNDERKTDLALNNSMPMHPDTLCIKESTPNGAGLFAEDWRSANWPPYDDYWKRYADSGAPGDPKNAYIRVFAAWWEFDEYQRAVDEKIRAEIAASLTLREKRGRELYQWSDERIEWRRWKIQNDCGRSEMKFDQDFPEDPVKCFLASGSPRFDPEGLAWLESVSRTVTWEEGLLTPGDPLRHSMPIFLRRGPNEAWLRVIEHPREGLRYIVVGDVSCDRDISPDPTESDRDKHSFGVFRAPYTSAEGKFHRGRLVARLAWPCEDGHDVLAKKLHLISQWYGNCPIAPEMNNHGLSLANKLIDRKAKLFSREYLDPKTGKGHFVYGWETGPKTRPDLLDELASSIRDVDDPSKTNGIEILCPHAVSELMTFVKGSGSNGGVAASGCHDDDVIMCAIGNKLMDGAALYQKPVVAGRRPDDGYRIDTMGRDGHGGGMMPKM